MNLHLSTVRPSTLLLAGLLIALFASTPVPLAVLAAVTVWLLHSPAALACGVVLTAAWRVAHPKAARS